MTILKVYIVLSCLTVPLLVQPSTFIPFSKMKGSQFQSFQYGYPDSVIGTIFPVFDVKYTECEAGLNMSDECLRGYLVDRCVSHYNKVESKMPTCPYYDDIWTNTRIEFVYDSKGLVDDKRIGVINNIISGCLNSENYLLPYLCGWDYFQTLLSVPKKGLISQLGDMNLLSAMYTYFFCLKASKAKIRALNVFCPNPCQKADISCNDDPNTWDGVCFLKKSGVYSNDYSCQCVPGFRWSDTNAVCIRVDNCLSADDKIYPCSRKGTNLCLQNFDAGGKESYICVCHFGFMGSMCESQRDSCVQRIQSQIIPGNMACQVYLGNLCIPYIGTDSYQCKCKSSRRNDNSQSFPNCFRVVTKCDGQVCYNNGQCTNSLDGSKDLCLCGSVWSGSMCRQPRLNTWLLWEPWSYCTVTCGKGWQIRRRICRTGNAEDCSGNDRDLKPCDGICRRFSDRYKPTLKMIILVQASVLGAMLVYLMTYIRMKVEVISMTKGIVDKHGNVNDARGIARWFEHRSKVIRENTAKIMNMRAKHYHYP